MGNKQPTNGFKKGKSGNPAGRPKKGTAIADILNKYLDKDKLVKKMLEMGYSGDSRAIQMICDRIDGKVAEKIDLRTPSDTVFNINIRRFEDEE